MKKQVAFTLALCGLVAVGSVYAEQEGKKPRIAASDTAEKASEFAATKPSVEEIAFAAKLTDSNRKVFLERLNVEQRKLAMQAAKTASVANAADEAVTNIFNSLCLALSESHETAEVANAESVAEVVDSSEVK